MPIDTPEALNQLDWLAGNAGPIIRYRLAHELGALPADDVLQSQLLADPEVLKWLDALRNCKRLTGSKDSAAINSAAKLCAYGLRADIPEFRDVLEATFRRFHGGPAWRPGDPATINWHPAAICLIFIGAGYRNDIIDPETVAVRQLDSTAKYFESNAGGIGLEGLLMTPQEKAAAGVSKTWADKHIWTPDAVQHAPKCGEFYTFSHLDSSKYEAQLRFVLESVASERMQRFYETRELEGGYEWFPENGYGRSQPEVPYFFGFFAFDQPGFQPHKFLLYLDLVSKWPGASELPWFREGVEHLEQYRTKDGRYKFPAKYMPERKDSYYLYAASHMRLGEKGRNALEIESTFRMLMLQSMINQSPRSQQTDT
jgi:hypothetical protein|tara:strand:+ start:8087 stop:9196 length:1110 start_codon:yes stop_codon:yes gene_type:complete